MIPSARHVLARLIVCVAMAGGIALPAPAPAADFTGPASAQEPQVDPRKALPEWEEELRDLIAPRPDKPLSSLDLQERLTRIGEIGSRAADLRATAQESKRRVERLLEELGPPPDKDGEPEPKEIAKRRAELTAELQRYESWIKQAALVIAQREQAVSDLSRSANEALRRSLMERGPSPLTPDVWLSAYAETVTLARKTFYDSPRAWWADLTADEAERDEVLKVLMIAIGIAVVSWPLRRWLRRRFGRDPTENAPGATRRLVAALTEGLTRGLMPVAFFAFIAIYVANGGITREPLSLAVLTGLQMLILYLIGAALIEAALAPGAPQWRLVTLPPESARPLGRRAKLTLVLFLLLGGGLRAISWVEPSVDLRAVHGTVEAVALTPVLISILVHRMWMDRKRPEQRSPLIWRLRILLMLALAALPVIAMAGYANLATYLLEAMVLTVLVLGLLWFLRTMLRESLAALLEGEGRVGQRLRDALMIDVESGRRLKFWLFLLTDGGLLVLGAVLAPPIWGLEPAQMSALAGRLFSGLQIGSYTFSLTDILLGIGLFIGIVLVTRLIQKSLADHVLPNLTEDKGVADALRTGVGYVGFVVAALIGVSVVGLDLTNLALVAGALSVGIGFGLQTIVNNFVSGLILLVERPIKPGDWVVIGGNEGTVKKVDVRSTEIVTFQRASVIIPNADLIASPVLNWTHKNLLGRIEVAVGVAYGSDVEKVRDILLACVREHPNVLSLPAPFVLFLDFGDSALNFEVRAYVRNVESKLITASDVRFAVNRRFAEAGIEIPFPQRVVTMVPPEPSPAGPAAAIAVDRET